jgi:P-type Ca2+ transporter type 2C
VLALVAGLFVMALRQNLPEPDARSLAFAALVATNLGLVLVNRSLGASVFASVILVPPVRELFHFGPLHGDDTIVALASGLLALLFLELAKRLAQPFFAVRNPQTGTVER